MTLHLVAQDTRKNQMSNAYDVQEPQYRIHETIVRKSVEDWYKAMEWWAKSGANGVKKLRRFNLPYSY